MKLVKELENGNLWWIDTDEYREATNEEIEIRELKIEAQKEIAERKKRIAEIKDRIRVLKYNLEHTDYKQAKWLDGALSEEEYAPVREKRQEWRNKINALEEELKSLEG